MTATSTPAASRLPAGLATAEPPATGPVTIAAASMLLDGALTGPGGVVVEGGRVVEVLRSSPPRADIVLEGGVLSPGLLDLQNNGAFGVDWASAEPEQWAPVLTELARHGVTGVQPTIVTAPMAALHRAFAGCANAMAAHAGQPVAQVLGVHLEGPFISERHKGVHPAEHMLTPGVAELDALLADPVVRATMTTITLAPELEGAGGAIARLHDAGVVVSIGHTDASPAQVAAAADAGASMVTHLFNAQHRFAHRDPGVPGAALCDDRLFLGLIIDGLHVDPLACCLVFRAAPGRVVGVTDSVLTAGLPEGTELSFAGDLVSNDEDGLGRRSDGTIAGAGILLDEGVRRMVRCGITLAEVLEATTETPARSLGRTDVGRIAVGARADLVWWDDALAPRRVWVGGVPV